MTDVEQRTAFANIHQALGLLSAINSGEAEHAHEMLEALLAAGRAEGLIKALCLLKINTGESPPSNEDLRDAALEWLPYIDVGNGERVVRGPELLALVRQICLCGHTAPEHDGRTHWPFWDFGEQTWSPCEFCECAAFGAEH